MNPVANFTSRTKSILWMLLTVLILLPAISRSQGNVTLTVTGGTSTTTCRDLLTVHEPQWAVAVDGDPYMVYPANGNCHNDPPQVQYDSIFNCPIEAPLEIEVCFKSFEDDGRNCNLIERCVETICANFPVAFPGTSVDYTLELPPGLSSGGSVNFTIETTNNFIGGINDIPCTAFDFGLIAQGVSVGDASRSIFNNFCASGLFEPNPEDDGFFRNEQGVWFTFETPSVFSPYIDLIANSDPENLGDDIRLQLALYESSNDSCIGDLSLVEIIYQFSTFDQATRLKCLKPSTRYWLMVDGVWNNREGYFGLELSNPVAEEGPDLICDATDFGLIAPNGTASALGQTNICSGPDGEPKPRAFVHQKTVWYSFLAPASGHVRIEAISDQDRPLGVDAVNIQLALFTTDDDDCNSPLIELQSQYNGRDNDETMIATCLEVGKRYWIMLDGAGNNTVGKFDMSVSDAGVLPPQFTTNINETLCFGESLQVGDSAYAQSGSVFELLKAANGCDSLVTGMLTISPAIVGTLDTTLCANASLTVGTDVFTVAGNYSSVLTAANGCDSTVMIQLDVLDPIVVTAQMTVEASGYLDPDGVANVTASGGAGNYTYLWSDGQTGAIAYNLLGGRDYCVTVTDSEGCTAEDCVLIFFPSNIMRDVVSDTLDCIGDTDGVLTITISNGAWPYDYNWESSDRTLSGSGIVATEGGSAQITGLPAGNYSFTISDGFGFAAAFGEVVNPEPIITAVNPVLCFGDTYSVGTDVYAANGQINTVLTSAKGCDSTVIGSLVILPLNITVLDETLCFGQSLTVGTQVYAATGPIDETLTAANGCDSLVQGQLTILNEVFSTIDTTVCFGESIVVGTSVYASSGDYQDVYPAANGCDSTVYTSLKVQTLLTTQLALVSEASALRVQDGIARAIVNGGSGSYTYLWSDGQITSTATGLEGGQSYCVTVTDETGCSASECLVVLFPVDIRSDIVNDLLDCHGDTDGELVFSAYNGEAPYQYTWAALNSNLTGQGDVLMEGGSVTLRNLPAGEYGLTITDKWGEGKYQMEVFEPEPLEVSLLNSTDPGCFDYADGSIEALITGGTQPYFYNGAEADQNFLIQNNLKGDTTYLLVFEDNKGCQTSLEFTLGEPDELIATAVELKAVRCFGEANGEAEVSTNAIGASYLWSNGDQTAIARNLEAGVHQVLITDQDGCTVETTVLITEPGQPLSAQVAIAQPISCPGEADGALLATPLGGTNYSYAWSNGSSEATATGLIAGEYTVTITDGNGCETEAFFSLTEPAPLAMTLETLDVTCTGGEFSGIINITNMQGGVGPYEYSLDGIEFGPSTDFLQLPSNAYDVYVKDALGCIKSFPALIKDPDYILVALGDDKTIRLGEETSLFANTDSNQPIYEWSSVDKDSIDCFDCSSLDVAPLNSIVYQVTVTDEVSGCTATDDIRVTVEKPRDIFIPNAFTPNSDGNNDVFLLFPGIGVANINQLQIFDRWGANIYAVQNLDPLDEGIAWDGMYRGKELKPGVYVYFAEVAFKDGEVLQLKGDVTLLR